MENKYKDEKYVRLEKDDLKNVAGGIKWDSAKDTSELDPKNRILNDRNEKGGDDKTSSLPDIFSVFRKKI